MVQDTVYIFNISGFGFKYYKYKEIIVNDYHEFIKTTVKLHGSCNFKVMNSKDFKDHLKNSFDFKRAFTLDDWEKRDK